MPLQRWIWLYGLAVLPLLAGCGQQQAAGSADALASRPIVISSLPTATPGPAGSAGASAQPATTGGGPLPANAPVPGTSSQAAPQAGGAPAANGANPPPYAAPTTLTDAALATQVAPQFAAAATATALAAPPTYAANPGSNQPSGGGGGAAPVAPTPTVSNFAAVTVTDNGFSPASVTISQGGTVRWTDTGQKVHSAAGMPGTSPIAPGVAFNTGGFGPNQSASLVFPNQGTFTYTSDIDCLHGNNNPQFGCNQTFTVNVVA
ncbi:MAG TPA: hypothetical protein VK009_07305 [Chloroflexota bacterium]|nr:hypothetical protein [Chloroflexota bacterium]